MSKNNCRRVVVTGFASVGPNGYSDKGWENLLSGGNYISDLSIDSLSGCYSKKYGIIDKKILNELEEKYLTEDEKKLTASTKLLLITSIMATEKSGIHFESFESKMRTGVIFGSAMFDLFDWDKETRFTATSDIAKHFEIHGETLMNANACSAGNHAIGTAISLIRSGKLDTVIAGGTDVMTEIPYVVFIRLKALSRDSIKPFDKARNGTILSEGAGVLILESLEHAVSRNAVIYGEVLGYGMSNDAFNIVAPDPSANGIVRAMKAALSDSGIEPDKVDVLSVHGTGTNANDAAESKAIDMVFGDNAKNISAFAIKSMVGHQLGAASAIAATVCLKSLMEQIVPPTINVTDEDEITFHLVKNTPEKRNINIIMSNAYAFGGSNCCIVLKRWDKNNE